MLLTNYLILLISMLCCSVRDIISVAFNYGLLNCSLLSLKTLLLYLSFLSVMLLVCIFLGMNG